MNTDSPQVTFVVPTLNPPVSLVRRLNRMRLEQGTLATWIVVDDGSDPACADVFSQLEHAGFTVIRHSHNQGLPAARNTGFGMAKTPYVVPLDDDDEVKPPFTRHVLALMETAGPAVAFVYTWAQVKGPGSSLFKCPPWNLEHALAANPCCSCAMIRLSHWKQAGGYSTAMRDGLEDWDLWLRFAELGLEGLLLPEPLFVYSQRPGSMLDRMETSGLSLDVHKALIRNHEQLYQDHMADVLALLMTRLNKNSQSLPERLIKRVHVWLLDLWSRLR